jgi:hypothetical protein
LVCHVEPRPTGGHVPDVRPATERRRKPDVPVSVSPRTEATECPKSIILAFEGGGHAWYRCPEAGSELRRLDQGLIRGSFPPSITGLILPSITRISTHYSSSCWELAAELWVTGMMLGWEEHTFAQLLTTLDLEAWWHVLEHFAKFRERQQEATTGGSILRVGGRETWSATPSKARQS